MIDKVKNRKFRITSPESSNRLITLSDPIIDPEIDSWEIIDIQREPRLVLKGRGTVYCRLRLKDKYFEGRDVRGGFTKLVPEPTEMDAFAPVLKRAEFKPPVRDDMRKFLDFSKAQSEVDLIVDAIPKTSNKAIAIVGCNRPQYMRQVMNGLLENDMSGYDILLFLDCPKSEQEKRFTEQQEKFGITSNVVKYPINFGCGKTIIDVRRQVFDRMGYEKAFIFEDDMVPGPGYIKFCENLLEWGQSRYTNVGAVQGWTKCLLPAEQKKALMKQIHVTYTNWWGYLTTKVAWDAVKAYIYRYGDSFLKGDYAVRPVTPILQYFKPQTLKNFDLLEGGLKRDEVSMIHRRRLFDNIPSGQDGATWMAYDNARLIRLAPTVNRGLYIGEQGIHSNKRIYEKDKFHKMSLDVLPAQWRIKSFELR